MITRGGEEKNMAAILVIEDDEFFQNFLELVMSGEGHEVRIADGGASGLAAAKEATPDLILCDMSMPEMTGFEVIRELKKLDTVKDVPVIALSAHDTAADHDEAFAAGATAYETKPIEMDRLINSVNAALEGRSPGGDD
jgi:CheY-like chemotaxis protein